MNIQKIVFYNHYHHGDLYHSKPFVMDLMHQLKGLKFCYLHSKDIRTLCDLDIPQFGNNMLGHDSRMLNIVQGKMNEDDALFINTWIGAYFNSLGDGQCSLKFTYRMWDHIFSILRDKFNLNVNLDEIEEYWPTIDYRKCQTANIDDFVESNKGKKLILICNGSGNSGQCSFNSEMREEICDLADKYADKIFITSASITPHKTNLFYTGDITKVSPDLNEISYLSQSCDLIIGRSSGPFCFSTTKRNINDSSKTFFCFGDNEKDSYPYDMPTKANYLFHKYSDRDTLMNEISRLIEAL